MAARSYAVVLNPAAGHRRAGRERAHLRRVLEETGVPFEIVQTERPGHAPALAREAAASFDVVVAAGGDGTLQEVATGLVGNDRGAALGLLPLGTGNDFAHLLGIPKRPEDAIRALLAAEPAAVDVGLVRWRDDGAEAWHEGVFVNAIGIGFDAFVADEARRFKRLRGQTAYLAAVFKGLATWAQPGIVAAADAGAEGLNVDGTLRPLERSRGALYRGQLFLVSVNNGPTVGGGFRLAPHARVDDGRLDLCLVAGPLAVARALWLLPSAMRGRHLGAPEVLAGRLATFALRAEAPLPIHADGEVLTRTAVEVEVAIRPGALRVLRPVPATF